jgi:hypothetical protein
VQADPVLRRGLLLATERLRRVEEQFGLPPQFSQSTGRRFLCTALTDPSRAHSELAAEHPGNAEDWMMTVSFARRRKTRQCI